MAIHLARGLCVRLPAGSGARGLPAGSGGTRQCLVLATNTRVAGYSAAATWRRSKVATWTGWVRERCTTEGQDEDWDERSSLSIRWAGRCAGAMTSATRGCQRQPGTGCTFHLALLGEAVG